MHLQHAAALWLAPYLADWADTPSLHSTAVDAIRDAGLLPAHPDPRTRVEVFGTLAQGDPSAAWTMLALALGADHDPHACAAFVPVTASVDAGLLSGHWEQVAGTAHAERAVLAADGELHVVRVADLELSPVDGPGLRAARLVTVRATAAPATRVGPLTPEARDSAAIAAAAIAVGAARIAQRHAERTRPGSAAAHALIGVSASRLDHSEFLLHRSAERLALPNGRRPWSAADAAYAARTAADVAADLSPLLPAPDRSLADDAARVAAHPVLAAEVALREYGRVLIDHRA